MAKPTMTVTGFDVLDEMSDGVLGEMTDHSSDHYSESVFDDGEKEELEITCLDDLPSSVSPLMQRKVNVKEVLNAVNKTLPQN